MAQLDYRESSRENRQRGLRCTRLSRAYIRTRWIRRVIEAGPFSSDYGRLHSAQESAKTISRERWTDAGQSFWSRHWPAKHRGSQVWRFVVRAHSTRKPVAALGHGQAWSAGTIREAVWIEQGEGASQTRRLTDLGKNGHMARTSSPSDETLSAYLRWGLVSVRRFAAGDHCLRSTEHCVRRGAG